MSGARATSFADRVRARVAEAGTPLVVGIDPADDELPLALEGPPVERLRAFALAAVAAAHEGGAAGVKVQAAFFEAHGAAGMQVLADTLALARRQGLLAIADAKRNDIGSTAQAYARAFFGRGAPFEADALTVSPYVGSDGVKPFLEAAAREGAGVFVLVRTSNVGGNEVQEIVAFDGRPVFERLAELLPAWERAAGAPAGTIGAVVGATQADGARRLRALLPDAVFLAPGVGAQGADPAALAALRDAAGGGLLVPVSRGISRAARDAGAREWKDALARAVADQRASLARALA